MIEGSGSDPEQDPDPYLWLMDRNPGGPKKCGSGGSGSAPLLFSFLSLPFHQLLLPIPLTA